MWKIIRASTIGTSHIKSGSFCQDSCYADVVRNTDGQEYLVIVVSDGAGSAKEGGQGAELTCETAISSISASLEKESDVFLLNKVSLHGSKIFGVLFLIKPKPMILQLEISLVLF